MYAEMHAKSFVVSPMIFFLPITLIYSDMLKLGSSRPWPDALEAISGTRKMSADSILEYFQPLMEWLTEENRKMELKSDGLTSAQKEHLPIVLPNSSCLIPSLLQLHSGIAFIIKCLIN